MTVRAITGLAELRTLVKAPTLTVIDFFATWCAPCKMIAPKVHDLAKNMPHVNFVQVDVDQAQDIVHEYRIQAMPTFVFVKAGNVLDSVQGADYNKLLQLCERYAVKPPPPEIPGDKQLQGMGGRQLLALMAAHNISAVGLSEKSDLITELKKYRK